MANIWRRSPSGRLTLGSLYNSVAGSTSSLVASGFFEAPVGAQLVAAVDMPVEISAALMVAPSAQFAADVTIPTGVAAHLVLYTVPGFLGEYGYGGMAADSHISIDIRGLDLPIWPPVGVITPDTDEGALTTAFPVEANGRTITGFVTACNLDDFYYRIHVIPSEIDVGNLLSDQVRTFSLWNAYLTPINFTSISGTDTDGITLIQPVTPPSSISVLRMLDYTLNISIDGPAVIAANYTWTFDVGNVDLNVYGRRVIIMPIGPNWKSTVNESLEWRTNVIRKYSGKEQRRALREHARRDFEYNFLVKDMDAQRLDNLLWAWQKNTFGVPVWTDIGRTTAPVSIGDPTILVDTSTRSYSESSLIVVGPDFESVEILSAVGGVITLKAPSIFAWPEGTAVYPVMFAHLPEEVPLVRHTDRAVSGVFNFTTSPVNFGAYTPDAPAVETYLDIEVLLQQPNWKGGLAGASSMMFDTHDAGIGGISWGAREDSPRNMRPYSWLLKTRDEIKSFREMLGRRMGQFKPIWVPSWYDDFTIAAPVTGGSSSIEVLDNGFRRLIGQDDNRAYIIIRKTDGTHLIRKITGVEDASGNTRLLLDAAFATGFAVSDVKAIHYLLHCRLATDKIVLQWHAASVVTVSTNFTTVPL